MPPDKDCIDDVPVLVRQWVGTHEEKITAQMAREIVTSLNRMRVGGVQNTPYLMWEDAKARLGKISAVRMGEEEGFTISCQVPLDGNEYEAYLNVNEDFTFRGGGILVPNGFKPPIDDFALSTAEGLYTYHRDHGATPDLYKAYAALSQSEIEVYVDMFCADDTDIEERVDSALYLALFAPGGNLPDRFYHFLIDNEVYHYGELYLRADEKFADELIAALSTADGADEDTLSVSHILCCLAAIPCRRTNDFLIENSCDPLPAWARGLSILPRQYAHVGGWEATDSGPRFLFNEEVTAFARCLIDEHDPYSPLMDLLETCRFCGQPLTLIFGSPVPLATCLYCSCYQTLFMRLDTSGTHWHEKNTVGEFFRKYPSYMEKSETVPFDYGVRPSSEKRHARWTANQFADITRTQIGGMPTPINDMDYPRCPDCGETMGFVAQLDMADVQDGEGLYYFFTCSACGITAANYDQS